MAEIKLGEANRHEDNEKKIYVVKATRLPNRGQVQLDRKKSALVFKQVVLKSRDLR